METRRGLESIGPWALLLVVGCASSRRESEALDAGSEYDGGRPPVVGEAGEDLPGAWSVEEGSERTLEELGPNPAESVASGADPVGMVWSGSEALLAWANGWVKPPECSAVGLDASGEELDGPVELPACPKDLDGSPTYWGNFVFFTGDRFAALYDDSRGGEREAYLLPIGMDLGLGAELRLTEEKFPVSGVTGDSLAGSVHLVFLEGGDLWYLRADLDLGAIPDSVRALTTLGSAGEASAAAAAPGLGVAFLDGHEGQSDLYFSLVTAEGEPTTTEGERVVGTAERADAPHVVWTGTEFAVVWTESLDGLRPVESEWFARVDEAGTPVAGSARAVLPYEGEPDVNATTLHQVAAVLATGDGFLVVATRERSTDAAGGMASELVAVRLGAEGAPDPDGLLIVAASAYDVSGISGTVVRSPRAVLVDERTALVAWSEHTYAEGETPEETSALKIARLVFEDR